MARVELKDALKDHVWYSVLFSLAAHRTHQAQFARKRDPKLMNRARREALLLSLGCLWQIQRLDRKRGANDEPPPELKALDSEVLESIKPSPELRPPPRPDEKGSTVSKTLAVRRNTKDADEKDEKAKFLKQTVEPSALVLLAGTILLPESDVALADLSGEEPEWDRDDVFEKLKMAVGGGRLNCIRLARVVASRDDIDARAHYNLACFFAQVHKRVRKYETEAVTNEKTALGRARDHFLVAAQTAGHLMRGGMLAWAARDPWFQPALERWDEGKELIEEALPSKADEAASQSSLVLAGLHAIGGYAPALQEAGVGTPESLKTRTGTQVARKELAEKLEVSAELVEHWADLARLIVEIVGIDIKQANLLEEVGVSTIEALSLQRAKKLHDRLVETNRARRIVRAVPAEATLEEWIAQAADFGRGGPARPVG
jgi:hypothetical protein